MAFGSPGTYPFMAAGGPQYLKMRQLQPAFEDVTDKHIYEDSGASYVLFNDTAPIRWIVEYDGLSRAQFDVLAAHHADAGHEAFGFALTNPRTATAYTGVHYDEGGWEEDHTVIDSIRVSVRLIKRPS
jgi:hypothetical protein